MNVKFIPARLRHQVEQALLTTDAVRALRSTLAFMVPLLWFHRLGRPDIGIFVATAAQNVALTDVRGDYWLRFAVLLTMTLVMAGSAWLGTVTGASLMAATLAMGALALLGGVWRHFSGDYGPRLGIVSALLFLIALALPDAPESGRHLAWLTLLGGFGGLILSMLVWFIRPQHSLRHAVAESWVAVSDLFTALRPLKDDGGRVTNQKFDECERTLRATLDQTAAVLQGAATKQKSDLLAHLEDVRYFAARLATRVSAFNTALDPLKLRPGYAQLEPTLDSVLRGLANASRSAALTIITHRPEQLTALDIRLRRCRDLLQLLDERLAAFSPADAEVALARDLLAQTRLLLPLLHNAVGDTVDHGAVNSAFPLHLPELGGVSLRSLSAWINPAPEVDSVLIRYSLRMAVVPMLAVAAYKYFEIPRGYWIAFTTIVVLQPDYGSTRARAGQRSLGTVTGSLLASALLWIKLPMFALEILAAVTAFCFAYFLKRRYALAIFFVTLMLVLAMETNEPLHLNFTMGRLSSIVAGGVLALLAALFFWPTWERQQFPSIMAAAIRANRVFLEEVGTRLATGEPFTGKAAQAKRRAERANSLAAASLQRMLGEPASQQEHVERAAALSTCNQRITRALTVLGVQLNRGLKTGGPELTDILQANANAMETLAKTLETESTAPASASNPEPPRPVMETANEAAPADLIFNLLARINTELDAMKLAVRSIKAPRA
jgi:uncharacterized membrane protein YccC